MNVHKDYGKAICKSDIAFWLGPPPQTMKYQACDSWLLFFEIFLFAADNVNKKKISNSKRRDYSIFAQLDEVIRPKISPQLALATFQFLNTGWLKTKNLILSCLKSGVRLFCYWFGCYSAFCNLYYYIFGNETKDMWTHCRLQTWGNQ